MRSRRLCAAIVVLFSALAHAPHLAYAGWNPDGVTISATTASILKVAACSDGFFGTYVVWQEESAAREGVLRIQHVLPSGDLEATWPAEGALCCNKVTTRPHIGVLPDGFGGLYIWWMEDDSLFVTRFSSAGTVETGWPTRGRALGVLETKNVRPSVIDDGHHGVYAAWSTGPSVVGIHFGPDGGSAGGWPDHVITIAGPQVGTTKLCPHVALAPDEGIYVAWGVCSTDT